MSNSSAENEALRRYTFARDRYNAASWLRGKKVRWILRGETENLKPNVDDSVAYWEAAKIRELAETDPWVAERLARVLES